MKVLKRIHLKIIMDVLSDQEKRKIVGGGGYLYGVYVPWYGDGTYDDPIPLIEVEVNGVYQPPCGGPTGLCAAIPLGEYCMNGRGLCKMYYADAFNGPCKICNVSGWN